MNVKFFEFNSKNTNRYSSYSVYQNHPDRNTKLRIRNHREEHIEIKKRDQRAGITGRSI